MLKDCCMEPAASILCDSGHAKFWPHDCHTCLFPANQLLTMKGRRIAAAVCCLCFFCRMAHDYHTCLFSANQVLIMKWQRIAAAVCCLCFCRSMVQHDTSHVCLHQTDMIKLFACSWTSTRLRRWHASWWWQVKASVKPCITLSLNPA